MSPYVVGILVFFALGVSGAYTGTLLMFALIGKVNRYRADDNQIPYFSFPPRPLKNLENIWIFGEYRRLYPRGRLHIYFFLACALVLIGFVGVMSFLFHMPPAPGGR